MAKWVYICLRKETQIWKSSRGKGANLAEMTNWSAGAAGLYDYDRGLYTVL